MSDNRNNRNNRNGEREPSPFKLGQAWYFEAYPIQFGDVDVYLPPEDEIREEARVRGVEFENFRHGVRAAIGTTVDRFYRSESFVVVTTKEKEE